MISTLYIYQEDDYRLSQTKSIEYVDCLIREELMQTVTKNSNISSLNLRSCIILTFIFKTKMRVNLERI